VSSYDQIAEWYDESIRANTLIHDLVVPVLFDLLGTVCGLQICDLACGQGIIARRLAQAGATVVGVDISLKLLDIAQREEASTPLGINYIHDDAQMLSVLNDASVDSVLCNMALMDIPDIVAALRAVQRVLRSQGQFVFSITHPCFLTPGSYWLEQENGTRSRVVDRYFNESFWRSENAAGVRGKVGAYHRTLSTYMNALIMAGLTIERIVEPQAAGERLPGYEEVPIAIVMLCRKG
jgi:ubiquinone/menaquinone biosynthesis C-methylase UbiE